MSDLFQRHFSLYETAPNGGLLLHAMPLLLGALCVLAIAYRYYSAFLAAKVAVLDDSRPTPAHRFNDGQNYHPTNKWVLFGHHFAAISGAGPLIGPVLAIQYGYMPGLLWLVIGVCLAGAVQDMLVLAASVRRGGKSLAEIARTELGPWADRRRRRRPSCSSSSSPWPASASSWSRRWAAKRSAWPRARTITLPAGAGRKPIGQGRQRARSTVSRRLHDPLHRRTPRRTSDPKAFVIAGAGQQQPLTAGRGRQSSRCRRRRRSWCPAAPGARSPSPAPSPSLCSSACTCTGSAKGRVVEASLIGAAGDAGGGRGRQLDSRLAAGGAVLADQGPDRSWP